MNILVVSDTHRDIRALYDVVSRYRNSIDLVIHLGDCYNDLQSVMIDFPTIAHLSVLGNCDYNCFDTSVKYEGTFTADDRRIFYTHGHKYNVKAGLEYLISNAKMKDADIVLYGHTHIKQIVENNGVLVINPGSLTIPRDGGCGSCVLLKICAGEVKYEIIEVQDI